MKSLKLTGIFWHEGSSVVSKCPELGVASCGSSVEEAMANLREAVELYLENARMTAAQEHIVNPFPCRPCDSTLRESIVETREILADQEMMRVLRQGIRGAAADKSIPWEEAKKKLGI
jgi:predicted RNase H-like HicB family nuclease